MKRLDWRLVRPWRAETAPEGEVAEAVERLVEEAATGGLARERMAELVTLEERWQALTVSPCEAVSAPRFEDDPDWESRLIDEYGESDLDLELEEFLAMRRREPDCERCPYASPYSLMPMDPCEFSAGALEVIVQDQALWSAAQEAMTPPQMVRLADGLASALSEQRFQALEEVDAADYLEKAIFFLRFWSAQGFGVRPENLDEAEAGTAQVYPSSGDPDDSPPVLH